MRILEYLEDMAREVGLTGAVDILVMSAFIYMGLLWFRRGRSGKVIQGILILGGVYLIARQLNMFLTTAVLEAFFAVFLLAVIVIFREEIRRFFEQLARWRPTRLGREATQAELPREIEVLTHSLAELSRQRRGALLVFPGAEPVDSHLDGGVSLNGEVSKPLLASLFDPHSIGHDGAVVVEDGRVAKFGAHLPLSTHFEELADRGTRHAAALGLAEVSDALTVVVSEERGTIAIARNGELRTVDSPEELAVELQAFLGKTGRKPAAWRHLLRRDYPRKLSAIAISLVLWFVLVHGSKQTLRRYTVPVEYTDVPANLEVASVRPEVVTLTFSGPQRQFYLLSAKHIRVVVAVPEMDAGSTWRTINVSDVYHPRELSLREVRPPRVLITATTKRAEAAD
jgi:uncharacterized protein (TIGR00159 family)